MDIVWTVGHSTRALDDLVALLQANGIEHLVDVRTIPRSRHNPQFNRETLPAALAGVGIACSHAPGLRGLRRPEPGSINTAWRNTGFRGYADYMQTAAFAEHLGALIDLAEGERVAIMCAESVPWRCHRSLIADALVTRGIGVEHILAPSRTDAHTLHDAARPRDWRAKMEGTRVWYPAGLADAQSALPGLDDDRPAAAGAAAQPLDA